MANHWRETGDFYVSSLDGNDTSGDGSIENPVKTISKAVLLVNAAGTNSQTIVVGTGVYTEGLTAVSSPLYTTIVGDGVVILNGGGAGSALSGYPSEWHIKNIHVVSFANLLNVSTNSGPQWFNCTFKGIPVLLHLHMLADVMFGIIVYSLVWSLIVRLTILGIFIFIVVHL